MALRQLRYNGWRIAQALGLSRATVCRILRRAGMNRLRSLDPLPPVVRYEHAHPGDLIHFDIKRLARIIKPGHRVHGDYTRKTTGAGYEYLHIAIDDHSRISFAAILPDQNHQSAMRFFLMTRAFYSQFGFGIKRVITDNGSCYRDQNFQTLLCHQRVKHRFTRPYTPRTNGKAERFIKTTMLYGIERFLLIPEARPRIRYSPTGASTVFFTYTNFVPNDTLISLICGHGLTFPLS